MQQTEPRLLDRKLNLFWSVHKHEYKKVLYMFTLTLLICLVSNILSCLKVTLVVMSTNAGAMIIPSLKTWVVLPASIVITILLTKVSSKLSGESLVYFALITFILFFFTFSILLYPERTMLQLNLPSDYLQKILPIGLSGVVDVIRNWHLSLFYLFSELWSTIMFSTLWWGFLNEINSANEAKRFYGLLLLGANISGFLSAKIVQLISEYNYCDNFMIAGTPWERSFCFQINLVILLCLLIALLFWRTTLIYSNENNKTTATLPEPKPKNPIAKRTLKERILYFLNEKYILHVVILVVSYNVIYNISDVLWIDQVKKNYPDENDFNLYLNYTNSCVGIFSSIFSVLLSGNIIRRFGWTSTALVTPCIWLLTGLMFFASLLLASVNLETSNYFSACQCFLSPSLVMLFGFIQVCFGKASKYSLFDETKEIALIPLEKKEKRKAKAVIDGTGICFGKFCGSFLIQLLLVIFGSLSNSIPYIAIVFLVVTGIWILSVRKLGFMVGPLIKS